MPSFTTTEIGDLHQLDYGAHIPMMYEEWNEPEEYRHIESTVNLDARKATVISRCEHRTYYGAEYCRSHPEARQGWQSWQVDYLIATYDRMTDGDIISIVVIHDGRIAHAQELGPEGRLWGLRD